MNQPFRFRRVPHFFALAVTTIALHQTAVAADLNTRLNVRRAASEVVIGQTMFDFYQGNNFAAMSNILFAKAIGRIDDSVTSSELLLGDLYTTFGMPDEADNVFSYVMSRDIQTQTRNETQFRKGRLQYRQGNFFEAERILNAPLGTELTDIEIERRLMLANIFMARNEYLEASNLLGPISINAPLGAYAAYNNGVAHLHLNQPAEGIRLLEQVMNLPVGDAETNALKDRAALAISYNYLQQKMPDKARSVLVNVRLKGPFSDAAVLALGYSHFERKDYKRALSFWLELLTRSQADPSVQEAMLLAPRAYEALSAIPQASYGYKLAVTTLDNQMVEVDKLAIAIKDPNWADTLNAGITASVAADPMAVPASVVPTNRESTELLYNLFAAPAFNEGFRQYQQLLRLKYQGVARADDLRSMRDMALVMQKRQGELPAMAARVNTLQKRLVAVSERWPILEKRARQAAKDRKSISTGTSLKDMERQYKLSQMEEALAKLPNSAANSSLKNRIRILKGVVLSNAASKVPSSQEQMYADISSNETQLQITQVRMEALQKLLTDNQKIAGADNNGKINALQTRLLAMQKSLDHALDEYRVYLRSLADNQLNDTRERLNQDLAEAHLSLAHLQDTTLLRDDRRSGAPEQARP
jgi:tetratricopeptide (TPR) repeat protein